MGTNSIGTASTSSASKPPCECLAAAKFEFKVQWLTVGCVHRSHTMGHICFLCTAPGAEDLIFTGDTLFVAGCGRCASLAQRSRC